MAPRFPTLKYPADVLTRTWQAASVLLDYPDETLFARMDLLTEVAASASTPWFAIGGIDAGRLPEVRAAGAERIVVVRAVTAAADPRAAAIQLRTGLD